MKKLGARRMTLRIASTMRDERCIEFRLKAWEMKMSIDKKGVEN